MRMDPARLLLTAAVWLAGCASGPRPDAPPEGSASAIVVTPPAPPETVSATQAPAERPKEAAAGEGGCFAKPVNLPGKGKFAPKPLDATLEGKLASCDRETDIAECRFAVARQYFEANHFEYAGPIYRDIALNSPGDAAPHAAQLYLECLNVLGS